MCRTLLLPLVVVGLALGLPFVRGHGTEHGLRAADFVSAQSDEGVLTLPDAEAHFTLFWPVAEEGGSRPLVIFAADARAAHPRPLRRFAEAAALAGVTAVYLAPTEAPADAAARLKGVLHRQAAPLGIDADAIVTWVEGEGFVGPEASPCSHNPLALAFGRLERDVADRAGLLHWALDRTLSAACLVKAHL
jgi:hypothetical protein